MLETVGFLIFIELHFTVASWQLREAVLIFVIRSNCRDRDVICSLSFIVIEHETLKFV